MKVSGSLLIPSCLMWCVVIRKTHTQTKQNQEMDKFDADIYKEIQTLKKTVASLSKQVMMQKFFAEEKARTEGDSGIKLVRGENRGLKNYEGASHLSPAAFAIHDHTNYDRTVGLGELAVVLNGVEFRTRHNDYKLVMPARTSKEYNAVENIPFPEVPPEVTNKPTVQEQITEMREWFRAFNKQDRTLRDYTKYFKPVFCYIEGAWTLDKDLEEPFPSDRHMLDATSWDDLYKKNLFTAYTGVKSRPENIAFLPRTIMSVNMSSGQSEYAQWNYRILCSPVDAEIPLSQLHQENDLTFRVMTDKTLTEAAMTRAARFQLYDTNRTSEHNILDDIFAAIPGKNNHGDNLTFMVFGDEMFDPAFTDQNVPLNMAYYHRAYKTLKPGAGGVSHASLGFNDDNLWVAQTTQQRVASLDTEQCTFVQIRPGRSVLHCVEADIRVSYAIPLEVIYMTPLLSWNPYNLTINNDTKTSIVDGRNGGGKVSQAYNGIDSIRYYMTPADFFSGMLDRSDPADTVRGYVHVLAPDLMVRRVTASGTSIILREIEGVGKVRLRYPIAPVHGEGSSVWKELNALKEKVLGKSEEPPHLVTFTMAVSEKDSPDEHSHLVIVTFREFTDLLAGRGVVQVTTTETLGHTHDLIIAYVPQRQIFTYIFCDGDTYCMDGHTRVLTLETRNSFTKIR